MKNILIGALIGATLSVSGAANAGYQDKSPLDITEFAVCTAAAMKNGKGLNFYMNWANALHKRYGVIFPTYSEAKLSQYTSERVLDKARYLNRNGIETRPAFAKFYDNNCAGNEP